MFKRTFFLALSAGILATVAAIIYSKAYFGIIVDFSEAVPITKMVAHNMLFTMAGCFLFFGLNYIFKQKFIAEFLFNLLITLVSIGMVFVVLKAEDPVFKNEDAALFIDYYKGFLMPMIFFPALSWMTLKPLFFSK